MQKPARYAALVLALALVAGACGGGDGDSLVERSAGDATGADAPVSIDDLPTNVGDIPGVSNECEALLNLFLSMGGVFVGGDVTPLDPGSLASLPPDVRDDALFVSNALAQFSEGLQDLGVDLSDPSTFATMTEQQQEAMSALSDSLDSEAFNEASDNLSAYGEQQCESQFGGVG